MGLASEYIDDGSSFISISPLSINPEFLTDFALYERYPSKDGMFRFRCLLMDTRSIETSRLKALIQKWDTVYIHKKETGSYNAYIRKNLEFILNHRDISVQQKTETLVTLSSEVIKDAFAVNFSSHADMENLIDNVEDLVSSAVKFLSDIKSLDGLADLINHDYNTHTHSIKVGWLIAVFIKANVDLFDLSHENGLKDLIVEATVAGFLHDLGKVKIPKKVLNKPGRLDNIENSLIQCHPAYAVCLLFDSPLSHRSAQAVLYHHENEDGSGYPCGLPGEDTPLLAKICHIVDVFDALTSERPYKKAKTPFEALKIMVDSNPYLDKLKTFEAEASELAKPPLTAIVRDDYNAKLRHLREREMLEEEGAKRVEVRMKLRDQGMSHCFDRKLLKRFIMTLNQSESFDLSGIL